MRPDADRTEAAPYSTGCSRHLNAELENVRRLLERRGIALCISGIDGSGKTTLVRQLTTVLGDARINLRSFHAYEWYLNLTLTPMRMLINRFFGKRLLIFDRCIYDNLVVQLARVRMFTKGIRLATKLVAFVYPRFDVRLCLTTVFENARTRRPDTSAETFSRVTCAYVAMAESAAFTMIQSDDRTLDSALRALCSKSI